MPTLKKLRKHPAVKAHREHGEHVPTDVLVSFLHDFAGYAADRADTVGDDEYGSDGQASLVKDSAGLAGEAVDELADFVNYAAFMALRVLAAGKAVAVSTTPDVVALRDDNDRLRDRVRELELELVALGPGGGFAELLEAAANQIGILRETVHALIRRIADMADELADAQLEAAAAAFATKPVHAHPEDGEPPTDGTVIVCGNIVFEKAAADVWLTPGDDDTWTWMDIIELVEPITVLHVPVEGA